MVTVPLGEAVLRAGILGFALDRPDRGEDSASEASSTFSRRGDCQVVLCSTMSVMESTEVGVSASSLRFLEERTGVVAASSMSGVAGVRSDASSEVASSTLTSTVPS